jgi:hypothetical protein
MKSIQEKQPHYKGRKSKRLEEAKLGMKVTTQPKRALKKEDFRLSTLDLQSSKR